MKTKPERPKFPRGHIDFAVSWDEIKCCAVCGEIPRGGELYGERVVTPAVPHPIGGLVGVCNSWYCLDESEERIIADWRLTAPRFIPIFADLPIQIVVRGRCNDAALAQVIRDTFDRIPASSRKRIIEYSCSHTFMTTTRNGMRFEALGRWPGMGDCRGMNMDRGHVIRLRASFVRQANNDDLIEVIAHELGHTEQEAEELVFDSSDECERDVEERLRSWGFDNGTTEEDDETFRDTLDDIIKWAEEGKAAILSGKRPSANYAGDAICEANKAVSAVIRATDRWNGC